MVCGWCGRWYQFPDRWCVTGFGGQLRLLDADRGTVPYDPHHRCLSPAGRVMVWCPAGGPVSGNPYEFTFFEDRVPGRFCVVDSCPVPPDVIRKAAAPVQMTRAMTSTAEDPMKMSSPRITRRMRRSNMGLPVGRGVVVPGVPEVYCPGGQWYLLRGAVRMRYSLPLYLGNTALVPSGFPQYRSPAAGCRNPHHKSMVLGESL